MDILPPERTDKIARSGVFSAEGDLIVLSSPYDVDFVRELRTVPGRRWDGPRVVNTFPVESLPQVRELAARWSLTLPAELAVAPDPEPQLGLEVDGDIVQIRFPYSAEVVADCKKTVPGAKWNVRKRQWETVVANLVQSIEFAERHGLSVEPGIAEKMRQEKERAAELLSASQSVEAERLTISGLADGIEPLPYQWAGINYAVKTRRTLIGDDPGLGKTLEALASVVAGNSLPAIIITTSTGKLTWEAEVKKFFPTHTAYVVTGTKPEPIPAHDFVILNYDICAQRADDAIALNPWSIIADESHYIKNSTSRFVCPTCKVKCKSNSRRCMSCGDRFDHAEERFTVRRGEGVTRISRVIPENGMKLMLTGTPITNRPSELVPQLEALDRIDEFGGRWRFIQRYCGGRGGQGATNLKELNEKMRSSFYIRRTQRDVWSELPPIRNSLQMMPVSAEKMRRYQEVEANVVHFLADRARELAESEEAARYVEGMENEAAVRAAGRRAYAEKALRVEAAEHLAKISVLKEAAVDLKYESMLQWVDEFLADNDEKVVIFAERIRVVEQVFEHFGDAAVKVRGGVSPEDRAAARDRFQNDPTCRVFVGNMRAASENITLTAASNVVFMEQAWTPSMHRQCVGRCYGRANDPHPCTAWYLLAPRTIDEDINALLEAKSKVVDAVTDGVEVEKRGSILADLVVSLAGRNQ